MPAVPTTSFSSSVPTTAVPDEAFLAQLQCQIEFYFSPRNLSRDSFLQNLLRNPQHLGAVPMESICSFPKIRDLYTLYWGSQRQYQQQYQQRHNGPIVIATPPPPVLVRLALERSTVIQVTEDGKFLVPTLYDDDDDVTLAEPTMTMQPRPESAESFETEESPVKSQPQKMVVAPTTPSTVNTTSSPSSPSSQTTASCASVPTYPLAESQQPSTTTPSTKERTTLIVRDIPEGSTAEQVEEVFTTEAITPKSVRPDVGHTWYVTFATEAEAVAALEACHEKTIQGQPVRARLKSELTNTNSLDATSPVRRNLDPFLSPHKLSANNKSMVVVTTPQEQMASYMRSQLATAAVATPPPMMPYAFPPNWGNVSPQLYPYPHGFVAPGFMPPAAMPYHPMAPPGTVFPFMAYPAFYPVEYHPQFQHQQAPPPNVFVRSSPTNHPTAGSGNGTNQNKKKKRKSKNNRNKNAKNGVPPPPPNHTISSNQSPVSSITTDGTTNDETSGSRQQPSRHSYKQEKAHHSAVTVASTATTASNSTTNTTTPALFPDEAFPALNQGGNTLRSSETHTMPHRPAYSEALKQKPNKNKNAPLSTFTSTAWPATGESTAEEM